MICQKWQDVLYRITIYPSKQQLDHLNHVQIDTICTVNGSFLHWCRHQWEYVKLLCLIMFHNSTKETQKLKNVRLEVPHHPTSSLRLPHISSMNLTPIGEVNAYCRGPQYSLPFKIEWSRIPSTASA